MLRFILIETVFASRHFFGSGWIRFILVGWIRIRNGMPVRIQKAKSDPQKYKKTEEIRTSFWRPGDTSVLWNRNYIFFTVPVPTFEKLWFRFRFRLLKKLWFRFRFLLLKSYGSGSGSRSISLPLKANFFSKICFLFT